MKNKVESLEPTELEQIEDTFIKEQSLDNYLSIFFKVENFFKEKKEEFINNLTVKEEHRQWMN